MMERDSGRLLQVDIADELKTSYLDYAMSVIIGRALPDVRDGLKPVHRRILYAMYEMGNTHNKPYKKSARVVGDVIGKYHPHGDAPVYDALVRMAQDFSMRYVLVDGHGNFGSIDGDAPAAMRYTEVRMARIAEEMLEDIEKETVEFVPNYDGSLLEPVLLPSRIPQLLLNGSSGIAVGMATNIPPHNLKEVVDALVHLIDHPKCKDSDLFNIVKGPDFPTGGFIVGRKNIIEAYKTGKGSISIRGRATVEKLRGEREAIVITEIPYQVNKAKMLERIAELVKEEKLTGISDIRDESDRDGLRVVIELKKGTDAKILLNQLYKHTQLQINYGIILLALINNQPKVMPLREMLQHFIDFRKEVVYRRTKFDLKKAEERAHILEGLKIAVEAIDEIISLIRASKSPQEAKEKLMSRFKLSEVQAQAILDMKLQKLTKLEREKIIEEYNQTVELIKELKKILGDEMEILKIIKKELLEIKEKYGDERRTEIIEEEEDFSIEDLIQEEDMVVTISHQGYIKRNSLSLYKAQGRGGKGKIGMAVKTEDFAEDVFIASTHEYILFFTNKGKAYWLKVHEIPQAGRATKGKPIINLISIEEGERVTAYLPVRNFEEKKNVFMVTKKGIVKKVELSAFSNPRKTGIIAITFEEGDELVDVAITDEKSKVVLFTAKGMTITFKEEDVRAMGRTAKGIRGIKLREGDYVVGLTKVVPGTEVLAVSEMGFGKRTKIEDFRVQARGGKGIKGMKITEKTGNVVKVISVKEEDEIILMTTTGKVLRLKVKEIPVQRRSTQGVRLIKLSGNEKVCGVAKVEEE
jgi:DNA gyrase subunit A